MKIDLERNNDTLIIYLDGELNSLSAPDLEDVISTSLKDVKTLILDFSKLVYISSAGLRVVLIANKIMMKQGSMKVRHISKDIEDILDVTGFLNFLDIEN